MAWEVIYTIYDAKARKSTHSVWLPGATTLANAQAFADAYSELLDAVIDGKIARVGIVFEAELGDVKADAVAGCDVENGALFIYDAGAYTFRHRVPTITPTLIVPTSRDVDTSDPDVAALIAALITGLDGVAPCEHRETDIDALKSARELFQRSRR
jgi:hypothetical protein